MSDKIVIAIDFGTTYSAIGYIYCVDGMNPMDVDFHIVENGWPGQGRRSSPKVPSVYKFEGDEFKYGFAIEEDPERVAFPKLFLHEGQLRTADMLAEISSTASKLAVDELMRGVAAFMRELRLHAREQMVATWDEGFVASKSHEYVLSVPAVWTEVAKSRTRECLRMGFKEDEKQPASIMLISEPEAAAIYTISTIPPQALKVGEVFVICDAGGGTVDLTAFTIRELEPQLFVDEVCSGIGGICGSVTLNMRFREFLIKKLGSDIPSEALDKMMIEFNDEVERSSSNFWVSLTTAQIKPAYDGEDEDYAVTVPFDVPPNPNEGLAKDSLVVTATDLHSVFGDVVKKILFLLRGQMRNISANRPGCPPPTIMLVGGFGSSEYLRRRIDLEFPEHQVVQPTDAWSAVVRGATLRAMVKKRIIRAAYGVRFKERWTSSQHEIGELAEYAGDHKNYDQLERQYFCTDRMRWYVKKGEEFDSVKTVDFPFYRAVGLHFNFEFDVELWGYADCKDGEEGPPFKDLDCRIVAVVPVDLSRIDRSQLPKIRNSAGEYFYKLVYSIEMSFHAMIHFRVKYKDQIYEVKTKYLEYDLRGRDILM